MSAEGLAGVARSVVATVVLFVAGPAAVDAQDPWSNSAPPLQANATVRAVVMMNSASVVPPATGSAGIMPGADYTIAPGQDDPTTGTSAKAEIQFNSAATVTVAAPTVLTVTVGETTFELPVTFTCAVAETADAQGLTLFPESCSDGFAWGDDEVSVMMSRWVMVGLSIPGSATGNAPAGTYTGTLTLNLATGGT